MSVLLLFPSVSVTPTGVLTFRRYRPSGRLSPNVDALPWSQARVDFNPAPIVPPFGSFAPWPLSSAQAIAPAQADPGWENGAPFDLPAPLDTDTAHPQTRSFSVAAGQGDGWYRVVFLDADGSQDIPFPPVRFPVDVITWRPTPDDVAQQCAAYTRHDIDTGEVGGGAQHGVFDDLTDPSIADVDGYIDTAMREIVGRVGISALDLNRYAELARQTAVWHAAATIEAEKASNQAMDVDGPAKWKQASYVACLNSLIAMPPMAIRLI